MCIKVHWINCYDNICCINLTPISVVIFTAPLQSGGRQARCQTPQPRSWWTCCCFQPCWMLSSCPLCPDTSSSLQGLQQLPPMWDLWVVMVQKKVRKARSSSGRLGWALPPCLTSGVLLFSNVAISENVMNFFNSWSSNINVSFVLWQHTFGTAFISEVEFHWGSDWGSDGSVPHLKVCLGEIDKLCSCVQSLKYLKQDSITIWT